jgi:hypothetical protein
MGVFSWLSKAFKNPRAAIGKVKEFINKAGQIYDKVKTGYGKAKDFVTKLPVIGGAASEAIKRGETAVADKLKSATGLTMGDIDRGIGTVRNIAQMVPA